VTQKWGRVGGGVGGRGPCGPGPGAGGNEIPASGTRWCKRCSSEACSSSAPAATPFASLRLSSSPPQRRTRSSTPRTCRSASFGNGCSRRSPRRHDRTSWPSRSSRSGSSPASRARPTSASTCWCSSCRSSSMPTCGAGSRSRRVARTSARSSWTCSYEGRPRGTPTARPASASCSSASAWRSRPPSEVPRRRASRRSQCYRSCWSSSATH